MSTCAGGLYLTVSGLLLRLAIKNSKVGRKSNLLCNWNAIWVVSHGPPSFLLMEVSCLILALLSAETRRTTCLRMCADALTGQRLVAHVLLAHVANRNCHRILLRTRTRLVNSPCCMLLLALCVSKSLISQPWGSKHQVVNEGGSAS